jgi:hypothetical protein
VSDTDTPRTKCARAEARSTATAVGDISEDTTSDGLSTDRSAKIQMRARHDVYSRLALASAVIWTLGTFVLFITFAAGNPRPIPAAMMSMTVPLVLAALPWLLYRPLTARSPGIVCRPSGISSDSNQECAGYLPQGDMLGPRILVALPGNPGAPTISM